MKIESSKDLRHISNILCGGTAALLAGWLVLNIRPNDGPGLEWVAGHVFLLVGYVLLLLGIVKACRRIPSFKDKRYHLTLGVIAICLSVAGTLGFLGQLAIDFAVGFMSKTQHDMDRHFDVVHNNLGLQLVCYNVGPAIFYSGLLVAIFLLVRAHLVAKPAAALATVGIVLIGFVFMVFNGSSTSGLYPLGLACLATGLYGFRVPSHKP